MTRILHVFGSTFDFAQIDPKSTLLTHDLLVQGDCPAVCHTSLGDVSINELIGIAARFERVQFHANTYDNHSDELRAVKYCLNVVGQTKTVEGYPAPAPIAFVENFDLTRSDTPVLWSFGCSYLDFADPPKKFDNLLADQLSMPLQRVAQTAKTTSWAVRQIARADIRPHDVVIWFVSPNKEKIAVMDDYAYTKLPTHLERELALDLFVKISNLHVGVSLLRARRCKFLLLSVQNLSAGYYDFFEALSRYREFVHTHHLWCDFASDGEHYGALTHKNIALALQDRVYLNYD